jgi:hypothetical protein
VFNTAQSYTNVYINLANFFGHRSLEAKSHSGGQEFSITFLWAVNILITDG